MCGIVGQVNFDQTPVCQKNLKMMTDAIAHRGPDGQGHWVNKNIGLGHRRLSIIDLSSAGNQPMISSDRRFVLTYNGEIYNFKELRSQLKDCGYQFFSESDSEVVLNALIEWGQDALLKFNGMFALALWDQKKTELLIARDRYGIKPLYFYQNDRQLIFGSEQKAILEQPSFDRKINKKALLEYFTFQNFFTNQTLVEGIYLLEAGHYATLNLSHGDRSLKTQQYWDYRFTEPEKPSSEKDYLDELRQTFSPKLLTVN